MSELQAISVAEPLGMAPEKFDAEQQTRMIELAREQKLVGTSVSAIADRFEEFLVETQNNRLDEGSDLQLTFADRFENQIINPIRSLDGELIAMASRSIDNCRRLLKNESELSTAVGTTTELHQEIAQRMKQIMSAMEESESFQEAVNKLLEIKNGENQIRADLQKRRANVQDDLDEDDIFDDD